MTTSQTLPAQHWTSSYATTLPHCTLGLLHTLHDALYIYQTALFIELKSFAPPKALAFRPLSAVVGPTNAKGALHFPPQCAMCIALHFPTVHCIAFLLSPVCNAHCALHCISPLCSSFLQCALYFPPVCALHFSSVQCVH